MKKFIFNFFGIVFGIIFGIFAIIIVSVTIYRYFGNYDTCRLLNIFEKDIYVDKHLFSSFGRDPYRICSFSFLENKEDLKDFKKIDEKYFKNEKIKFAFENLDYLIKDEAKEYTQEEKIFLKNMKDIFKKWEKDEEIVYNFFYIYDNNMDFEICYYKKSENKGYCIVNHM